MKMRSAAAVIGLSLSASAFALSENYSPVRIEIGSTFPIAFGDPTLKGVGIVVEPKVNITDQIAAGLRAELGILLGGDENSAGAMAFRSYLAKGEYFFNTNDIRPFAGFGAGIYTVGAGSVSASVDTNSVEESASAIGGNYFGIVPSFGVNLKGFRAAAGMNLIFAKEQSAKVAVDATTGYSSISYEEKSKLRPVLSIEFSGSIMSKKKTATPAK